MEVVLTKVCELHKHKPCCGCSCHVCANDHDTGGNRHTEECQERVLEEYANTNN